MGPELQPVTNVYQEMEATIKGQDPDYSGTLLEASKTLRQLYSRWFGNIQTRVIEQSDNPTKPNDPADDVRYARILQSKLCSNSLATSRPGLRPVLR